MNCIIIKITEYPENIVIPVKSFSETNIINALADKFLIKKKDIKQISMSALYGLYKIYGDTSHVKFRILKEYNSDSEFKSILIGVAHGEIRQIDS